MGPAAGGAEHFRGALLGVALGDALGARHEGGPGRRVRWADLCGGTHPLTWTDDTEMTLELAESLAARGGVDPDDLARRWAAAMQPHRGYGPGTRALLLRVRAGADWRAANRSVFPEGSFGNGAAMRATPLGLLYHADAAARRRAAEAASAVTHAHPLGIEGAVLIAQALHGTLDLEALARAPRPPEYRTRLERARAFLAADPDPAAIRRELGHSVLAPESAVTAVYLAARAGGDFSRLVEAVLALGGDTDTIGAMAGGIFGARHGAASLPADLVARLEQRARLERAADALWRLAAG